MSANIQALCNSFMLEQWEAYHQFSVDTLKIALYNNTAVLSKDTTAYTATGEVSGTGYTAGGITLAIATGFPKAGSEGNKVLLDFDDVSVAGISLTTNIRYGLIYNSSKSNRAIAVLDFIPEMSVSNTFGIQWPVGDDSHAIIRLSAPAGG